MSSLDHIRLAAVVFGGWALVLGPIWLVGDLWLARKEGAL